VCAAVSLPLLWVPLMPALKGYRWGMVLMMLIGRIPAAPLGRAAQVDSIKTCGESAHDYSA